MTHELAIGVESVEEGAAGKKGELLSSDLNKLAWICQSVYPSIWSERGAHTQNNNSNKPGRLHHNGHCVVVVFYCSLLIVLCYVHPRYVS